MKPETHIETLAQRYAASVQKAKVAGWLPVDWKHLDPAYWREQLLKQPNWNGHLVDAAELARLQRIHDHIEMNVFLGILPGERWPR